MIQLSIIVTVYNREKYIERCIRSLFNQGLNKGEYEIVVVNDGSTDRSEEIITNLAKEYSEIRLVQKENSGVADTRNLGLKCARGTYITYVDSDDFLEENAYSELLEIAHEEDYDIVIFDIYKTFEDHREYNELNRKFKQGEITPKEYLMTTPSPCNKLMKKELFEKGMIRFPSGIYYEDYATIPLLANEAQKIYYLKKPLYNYFQENCSITRTIGFQKKWWDMYTASVNLSKLDPVFCEEEEFLIYLYLLVRTGIWYLRTDHFTELNKIVDYVRTRFPNWWKNEYVKKRPVKEKIIAYLLYQKKGKYIRRFQNIKKGRNNEK